MEQLFGDLQQLKKGEWENLLTLECLSMMVNEQRCARKKPWRRPFNLLLVSCSIELGVLLQDRVMR